MVGQLVLMGIAADVQAAPEAFASCDLLGRHYVSEVREFPMGPPDLWWIMTDPCEGDTLAGNPPPTGQEVWCEDRRGRRAGPQTAFRGGQVISESTWSSNNEVGPRFEYGPDSRLAAVTQVKNGNRHGERVEWAANGGVTIVSWVKGVQQGPMWHFDANGALSLVSHWREGVRHGRVCHWRNGELEVSTLWKAGEPILRELKAAPEEEQAPQTTVEPMSPSENAP
ncbi:MAG: hypothetical protein KTR31_00270 [Myxococcales bacterium]|nr:hypothetical protein [Myxococcales bacterium]